MPCPDYVISAGGRQGIGVVQPQSGLDYPLIGPRIFSTRDYEHAIRYLLADFYFAYDDPAEYNDGVKIAHPLRIKYLYGIGCVDNVPAADFPTPTHPADIVLVDVNDAVAFDSTTADTFFAVSAWGTDYKIYTWKQARAICRLVAHTTWAATDNEKQQYDKYMAPEEAILDERAVYRIPRRVLSMCVRNGATTTPKATGAFVFLNGYNTEIATADPTSTDFRTNTAVTFAAVPGSGLGRYIDCTESLGSKPITRINGVGPDSFGNFLLSSSDCLWARRPTTYAGDIPSPSTTAQLQIGADCGPCCSCNEYAATAKYMNDTSTRYRLIGQRADGVRRNHEQNIERWNAQRTCSLLQPLKLLFVPQGCPYIDVIAMLCNTCETCLEETILTLVVSFEKPGLVVELDCGYTTLFATGSSGKSIGVNSAAVTGGTGFTFNMPKILPNDSAYVKLRLKFLEPGPKGELVRARGPYQIAGTLTALLVNTGGPLIPGCGDPNVFEPAAAADIKTLYCTDTGRTEAPC